MKRTSKAQSQRVSVTIKGPEDHKVTNQVFDAVRRVFHKSAFGMSCRFARTGVVHLSTSLPKTS